MRTTGYSEWGSHIAVKINWSRRVTSELFREMSEAKPDSNDRPAVLKYSDRLYVDRQWAKLLDYLRGLLDGALDPELLWRLLRCAYRLGKQALDAGDTKAAERVADDAMELAEKGLAGDGGRHDYQLHKVSVF